MGVARRPGRPNRNGPPRRTVMSEEQALQIRPGRGYWRGRRATQARRHEGTDRGHPGSDLCRRPVGGDRPGSSASVPPAVMTTDVTGAREQIARVGRLRHAVAFVGARAGLSRMAGAVGTPVVLIGGCTDPTSERRTPHPVIDRHVCNDWGSDVRRRVDRPDAPWRARRRHGASVRRHKADHRRVDDRDFEAGRGGDRTGRAWPGLGNASLSATRTTRP